MIVSLCIVLLGKGGLLLGVALSTPFTLSVVAIIFIADYVVYRDLFHHDEAAKSRDASSG
jgi:hypoxanthine phosphoribosyltransferase